MEQLKETIMRGRKMKESTWKIHARNMEKLMDIAGVDPEDFDLAFVPENIKLIETYLKLQPVHTKKAFLSTLLVLLSPEGRGKIHPINVKIYNNLNDKMKALNKGYLDERKTQLKNPREAKNWIDSSYLEEVFDYHYNKFINSKPRDLYKNVRDLVIYYLYTFQPPRRTDYISTKVTPSKEYNKLTQSDKDNNNYLVVPSDTDKETRYFFSFGKNCQKSKVMDTVTVPVSDEMKFPLITYLSIKLASQVPAEYRNYFLLNNRMKPYTNASLSAAVTKIFSLDKSKRVGVTMLRHFYISRHFANDSSNQEKKDLADAMGHTVNLQQNVYRKI